MTYTHAMINKHKGTEYEKAMFWIRAYKTHFAFKGNTSEVHQGALPETYGYKQFTEHKKCYRNSV